MKRKTKRTPKWRPSLLDFIGLEACVWVAVFVLLPVAAHAQNWTSTKAQQQFARALTQGTLFGVPRYTTVALPACDSTQTGAVAWNTTTASLYACDGSAWAASGGGGALTPGTTVITGCTNQVIFSDAASKLNCKTGFLYTTASDAMVIPGTGTLTLPAGAVGTPSLTFTGAGTNTGFYSRTANVLDLTIAGVALWDIQATQYSLLNTMQLGFSVGPTGTAMNVGFANDATGVIRTTNGSTGVGWIQNGQGSSRVTTADITNATATFAAVTGITSSVTSGRKYAGRLTLKVVDSTAADGIQIDFNGGAATFSAFWAACHQDVGGTVVIGTAISTSLAGVINFTTITGETIINCDISGVASSTNTFIPRQAQNTHSTGTLTTRIGSYMLLEDIP